MGLYIQQVTVYRRTGKVFPSLVTQWRQREKRRKTIKQLKGKMNERTNDNNNSKSLKPNSPYVFGFAYDVMELLQFSLNIKYFLQKNAHAKDECHFTFLAYLYILPTLSLRLVHTNSHPISFIYLTLISKRDTICILVYILSTVYVYVYIYTETH